ncbi:MAG: hypothetical protein AAGB93_08520 [Planctomycetota bacterium]
MQVLARVTVALVLLLAPSCAAAHHRVFSSGVLPGRVLEEEAGEGRIHVELARPKGREGGAYEVRFPADPCGALSLTRLPTNRQGAPSRRGPGRQVTMLGSALDGPDAPRPGEFRPFEVLGPGDRGGPHAQVGYDPDYRYYTSTLGLRHDEDAGELVGYRWSEAHERWDEAGRVPLAFRGPPLAWRAVGWGLAPLAYGVDGLGIGVVSAGPFLHMAAFYAVPIAVVAAL